MMIKEGYQITLSITVKVLYIQEDSQINTIQTILWDRAKKVWNKII